MRAIFLFLAALFALISADERVTVTTAYGKVRGFRVPLTDGSDPTKSDANVFLGIPFAKPPVGPLRFEKPQPPDAWTNVREADKISAQCTPLSKTVMRSGKLSAYSEDCLYLNVIAPNWKNDAESKGFPVMVFIHGGGFVMGSAAEFGYKHFVAKYLPRDVIIVTVQYRLAQFGFATINGTDLMGNYGLWDLVAALKFVRENIARFGGDRDRVTVFGHSAGGAAVGHLNMSPHTQGLFVNAIQMSGSPYADWATTARTEASDAMAEALGCAEAKSVKSCLQQKTTDEILDAVEKTGRYRHNSINFLSFVPHFDGDFHPWPIADSPSAINSKPAVLIGVADSEALAFTVAGACHNINDIFIPSDAQANFNEESFVNAMKTFVANKESVGSEEAAAELLERLVDFYIRRSDEHTPPVIYNGARKNDNTYYIRQYTRVISDAMFLVPILIDAQEKAKAGWPVFLYRFGFLNASKIIEPFRPFFDASTHGGEYPYLFDIHFDPFQFPFDEEDFKFQDNYLSTLIQFAKTSDPTSTVKWPRLVGSAIDGLSHVELAPDLLARDNLPFLTKTLAFWRGLRADFNFPEVWQFPKGESARDEL